MGNYPALADDDAINIPKDFSNINPSGVKGSEQRRVMTESNDNQDLATKKSDVKLDQSVQKINMSPLAPFPPKEVNDLDSNSMEF